MHFCKQLNCWSLRYSWSSAGQCCSNYIFMLLLTLGLNILHKDNCKPRRETFKFCDLVRLILEILWYSIHANDVLHIDCETGNYSVCSEFKIHLCWGFCVKTLKLFRTIWHFQMLLNENYCILMQISLKYVPKGLTINIPALVQMMTLCQTGNKPLSEPKVT